MCQTQWRVSEFGPIGLDYPAVFQIAKTLNIDINPAMLRKLHVVEQKIIDANRGDADGSQGRPNNHNR